MLTPEAATLLYREVEKTIAHPQWGPTEKVLALAVLLERLFVEATRQEQLAFSTLFARISYAGHQYNIQPDTLQAIHTFRRIAARVRRGHAADAAELRLGVRALGESILIFCQTAIPPELLALFPAPGEWSFSAPEIWEYKARARVVVVRDDSENQHLIAIDEEEPGQQVRVRYNIPDRNDNFNPSIRLLRTVFRLPVTMNLLDVDIDRNGDYRPRAFVFEPDYLFDVSAVSECFKDMGAEPLYYLVKKFLPYENTAPILLGNIANFFLDRLLNEPEARWEDLIRETFQMFPFAYAPMTDVEVKTLTNKSQKHFLNLKKMASGGLAQQGIAPEDCVLEPTFFSEHYGLQGRLDLFFHTDARSAIVELKSGTPFKPNSYGIQRSHFTQTLLYDLLVRSVFGRQTDPVKYILYSGMDEQPLRFAPTVVPEQWEALQVRNHLVAIEYVLAAIRPGDDIVPLLARLRGSAGQGFTQRDFAIFEGVYGALEPVERKYFNAFAGFIAREHWLAKAGDADADALNGNAALWRNSFAEKQQAFALLSHLEIADNRADQPDPCIIFRKTTGTNPLANFRTGDIAVLYPAENEDDTVLDHQVIKCTITELGKEKVVVQLRYRQFNLKAFDTNGYWNLEPDLIDTGFVNMYRGLFEWAAAPKIKRSALLQGLVPGRERPRARAVRSETLTPEQALVFENITRSQDFFLLWGPPGTGKTSVMLRALADWVLRDTTDSLLLLAYTNRAVDEICEALDTLITEIPDIRAQYLRIGSRFSTAERFREQLLHTKIAGVKRRTELREILEKHRIFVSTVASFSQNDNLLRLKKFQRLVVDEASQLLEPQLVGLLTRFEHFVLIGDHRQLPAVTAQGPERTRVEDPDLRAMGLYDLRDSYFERLYRRCEAAGRHDLYGRLSHQGRMHADIMAFPNQHFYNGFLKTLPTGMKQFQALDYAENGDPENDLEQKCAGQRVVFLHTPVEENMPFQKTNRHEAELAARLVVFFKKIYAAQGKPWNPTQSLGIITPWRAQIAQLREALAAADVEPEEITIDTVERYQGGARDVIILSCCVNSSAQLASLVSLSAEGVDRKLNVALTRAREHVLVLGNAEVLRQDERYQAFVEKYLVDF